jgi:hypothetical protein
MEDGPDTPLTIVRLCRRSRTARLPPGQRPRLRPSRSAAGAGFTDGYPKILFEPHRFCRLTKGVFSGNHPDVSYQVWGTRPYPAHIEDRYSQLLEAVSLDVYAGFAAASYGKFQIMGENHERAATIIRGHSPLRMAFDEPTQLKAFESVHPSTHGLLRSLCRTGIG